MAEGKKGGNWQMIVAIGGGGIALAAFGFIVAFSIFGGGGGPNRNGAQAAGPVNPADPKTASFISSLNTSIDPSHFLQLNRPSLSTMDSQISAYGTYLETDPVMSTKITGVKLLEAKKLIGAMRDDIKTLTDMLDKVSGASTLANVTNPTDVEAKRTDIAKKSVALQNLVYESLGFVSGNAASALTLARAIVDRNEQFKNIPYKEGLSPNISKTDIVNGTYKGKDLASSLVFADCSGFVGYVFVAVGVLKEKEDTGQLANDKSHFTVINADKNADGVITGDDIQKALADGTLLPGDLLVTGLSGLQRVAGDSHAMIINDSDYTSAKALVMSTTTGGKSGPLYQGWPARLRRIAKLGDKIGDNVQFLRPNYPKA